MKNKMRPVIAVILFSSLLLAVSCGGDKKTTEVERTVSPEATEDNTGDGEPTRTIEATATKRATPKPSTKAAQVEVLNYLAKSSDFGLYFVGEVVNNGDEEAGSIDIVITLTDEAGNVVGTGSDVVGALSILPPGGKLPFRLYISDPPASWANEKIQVQFDEVTSFDRSYSYTEFETAGVTVTPAQYSGIIVRGQVTNTGSVNAELV